MVSRPSEARRVAVGMSIIADHQEDAHINIYTNFIGVALGSPIDDETQHILSSLGWERLNSIEWCFHKEV